MSAAEQRVTKTGGRDATTRRIPPELALAVTMPSVPAPSGWKWSALADIARLESGHTPSRKHSEYWGGSIPWISIADAKTHHGRVIADTIEKTNSLGIENSSARVLPARTVCLSRTASVGYVVVMERPMATSQDFVNWVCSSDIEPEFLKYLFIAEGEGLLRFASGAVHQTIYFPEAKAFHICHPPAPEQRRIVAILDKAFERIAIARANAEKNLQNSRELFESELEIIFDSGPAEWPLRSVGEVGEVQTGSTPKTSDPKNYGDFIPFIKPGDFREDGSLDCSNEGLSKEGLSKARRIPRGSALMVCIGATIGKCGYSEQDVTTNQQINSVAPASGISPKFVYLQMLSAKFQRAVRSNAGQATLPIINKSKWSALQLAIPATLDEQMDVVRRLDELRTETQRLESIYRRKLATLDELKQSLLHQAFSGQL